jgi:hypothetical protein
VIMSIETTKSNRKCTAHECLWLLKTTKALAKHWLQKNQQKKWDIDLRTEDTIHVLERLYLSPVTSLKAPYIPVSVPFGTDTRTSMRIIAEESAAAARRVETGIQKYAAVGLTPEMIAAGSELVTAPFLKHLMTLRENWASRSKMEDSQSARTLNFRFLNSGLTGGYTKDYLEFVERLDRLSILLAGERK